jgi:uncharacterized protein YcbX
VHVVDGYIAPSPSAILSKYFGKPVHLVYKGPVPRQVKPTVEFPNLHATAVFQDTHPLLILSEEGMADVEREVRERIGQQGIRELWREEKVAVQRWGALSCFLVLWPCFLSVVPVPFTL